jgi:hypothetical protein
MRIRIYNYPSHITYPLIRIDRYDRLSKRKWWDVIIVAQHSSAVEESTIRKTPSDNDAPEERPLAVL